MAAKRNPISEKAYEMYMQGMKLVDIAANLQVPPGTVRRWKSTHNWDGERSASKSERSDCQKGKKKQEADEEIRDFSERGAYRGTAVVLRILCQDV